MTTKKDMIKLLSKNWEQINSRLSALTDELKKVQKERYELIAQLSGLLKTFEVLGEHPSNLIIPAELVPKRKGRIGDFIENILEKYGTLTRSEIEVYLRQMNINVSLEHARIVVANAIKRDAKRRFVELEDGKIGLQREYEKADAKG